MTAIENQTFTGTTIFIDGKLFLNCQFHRCLLVFGGGDFGWKGTILDNCTCQFEGPAERTIRFLTAIGTLKRGEAPKPTAPANETIN